MTSGSFSLYNGLCRGTVTMGTWHENDTGTAKSVSIWRIAGLVGAWCGNVSVWVRGGENESWVRWGIEEVKSQEFSCISELWDFHWDCIEGFESEGGGFSKPTSALFPRWLCPLCQVKMEKEKQLYNVQLYKEWKIWLTQWSSYRCEKMSFYIVCSGDLNGIQEGIWICYVGKYQS